MKKLLVVLLLVFLNPITAHDDFQDFFDRIRIVKDFNNARHEYSIGLQTANMRELDYNIELAQEAKTFVTCDEIKHGSNYRVLLLDKNWSYLNDPDARLIKMNKTAILDDWKFKRDAEFLHPLQNEVGCVTLLEKCPYSQGQPMEEASWVCLFGPKNTDPISEWKHGKPRSQCPSWKAWSSGLCL